MFGDGWFAKFLGQRARGLMARGVWCWDLSAGLLDQLQPWAEGGKTGRREGSKEEGMEGGKDVKEGGVEGENDNSCHGMSTYFVPGTVLGTFMGIL